MARFWRECGLNELYDLTYREGSGVAHAQSTMWRYYFDDESNTVKFHSGTQGIQIVSTAGFTVLFGVAQLPRLTFADDGIMQEPKALLTMLPKSFKRADVLRNTGQS